MKIRWLYILLTLLSVTHTPVARSEIIDSSVAVVNEDVITLSDVNRIGEAIFRQITEEAPPEQREEALKQARKKIITQLIENKLLTQQAAALHISVAEAEIDRAQKQVLQRNGFTDEDFKAELKNTGLSQAQYRETLREQILRSKLINYEVRSKVVVPDEEIQRYFEQQYSKETGKEAGAEGYSFYSSAYPGLTRPEPPGCRQRKKTLANGSKLHINLQKKGKTSKNLPANTQIYLLLPTAATWASLKKTKWRRTCERQ